MRAIGLIPLCLLLGIAAEAICQQAQAGLDAMPDLSGYATQAQLPRGCSSTPAADTLDGSPGAAPCYVSSDATRPTVVQAANVTTDANGAWSVTWARPFVSPTPVVNPLPVNTGTLPILCNVATRSGSGASGKCWQSTATTLPATVASVLGLVVSPFGTAAAGAQVSVIAREPTQ